MLSIRYYNSQLESIVVNKSKGPQRFAAPPGPLCAALNDTNKPLQIMYRQAPFSLIRPNTYGGEIIFRRFISRSPTSSFQCVSLWKNPCSMFDQGLSRAEFMVHSLHMKTDLIIQQSIHLSPKLLKSLQPAPGPSHTARNQGFSRGHLFSQTV